MRQKVALKATFLPSPSSCFAALDRLETTTNEALWIQYLEKWLQHRTGNLHSIFSMYAYVSADMKSY